MFHFLLFKRIIELNDLATYVTYAHSNNKKKK